MGDYVLIYAVFVAFFQSIGDWFANLTIKGWGNVFVYVAGFVWSVELFPQLIKTHRSKCVEGISLAFFIASIIAYVLYMIGNGMLSNWNIVYAHIPALFLTLYMAILILKYKE